VFNIGIGFEAVVEEMGVREAVNAAIERDAFEEEGGGFEVPERGQPERGQERVKKGARKGSVLVFYTEIDNDLANDLRKP
jgi:hypothetical protein